MKSSAKPETSAGGFVVAGGAAGFAVEEAVLTKANFEDRLAEAAVFFAVAALFRHLALHAAVLSRRRGGHRRTVPR